jgi:copper resistance protein B
MTTVTSKTVVAICVVLALWPTVASAQGTPAAPEPTAQADQSAQQVPADPAPYPSVPPLTDADRVAAFPDVSGHPMPESAINHFVLFDQLEWQAGDTGNGLNWENKGWIGGDLNRFWFRTEGDGEGGRLGTAFAHALYGRAIARWWDVVAGVRQDIRPGPVQTWAAVGIQGIAPDWFEVEATAYIGASGRTHVRFETEYELLLTNRLVLQPRVEFDIYGKSDPEHRVGAGLSTADAGIRVRYEFRRELAPYVGVVWNRNFFGTADLTDAAGEKSKGARVTAGLRFWF